MRDTFRTAWPHLWRYRRGLAIGIGTILSMELLAVSLPLLIVVLERGRVTQRGTHAQLVIEGGYDADRVREQMIEEELNALSA